MKVDSLLLVGLVWIAHVSFGQQRYTVSDEDASGPGSPKVVVLRDHIAGTEVAVAPSEGGELASFKVTYQGRLVETLYHARDYDHTTGFQGKGPLLWPAVGAQFPLNTTPKESCGMGSYKAMGRTYPMPCHGFAHLLPWKEVSRAADAHSARVTVELTDSEATRKFFPYAFRVDAKYEVLDGHLTIDYVILSGEGNSEAMPFSIGNHLSFKLPFVPGTDPAKMLFETQSTVQLLRDQAGFVNGEKQPRSFYDPTPLGTFDARTALPLAGYRGQPFSRVIDPRGMTLRTTQTASTTLPEPLIRTNAYGGPGVGYFCPEPWFGVQNSLNTGVGLVKLKAGESWTWRLAIELEAPPLASRLRE